MYNKNKCHYAFNIAVNGDWLTACSQPATFAIGRHYVTQ